MRAPIDDPSTYTSEPPLPEGVWTVDPQRSEVGFAAKSMWGLATVRGVFRTCEGSVRVQGDDVTGELTVDAASVDTGHAKRDSHLRSPDFFDVERHPRIVFTATAATALDRALTISGELAITSSRVGLALPVDLSQPDAGTLRLEGRTTVSRAATGMTWNWLRAIGRDAELHARLTLQRAAA